MATLSQADLKLAAAAAAQSRARAIIEELTRRMDAMEVEMEKLRGVVSRGQHIDITPETPAAGTVKLIQDIVAEHFGISRHDLVSMSRQPAVCWPRQIAVFLCRMHTAWDTVTLGRWFRGRDHSSISHAANVVRTRVGTSRQDRETVSTIQAKLVDELKRLAPSAA